MIRKLHFLAVVAALYPSSNAIASTLVPQWSEGECSDTISQGANREYYNSGASFKWQNYLGDWADKNAQPNGSLPYDTVTVQDQDSQQRITLDATQLVQGWLSTEFYNQGFYLRNASNGKVTFHSRESNDSSQHPTLLIETNMGSYQLEAFADTTIKRSTYRCSGHLPELSAIDPVLLQFDFSAIAANETVLSADLVLHTTENQYGNATLELYRTSISRKNYSGNSLAGSYPNDYKLKFDDSVYMVESFESSDWKENWSRISNEDKLAIVESNADQKFEPIAGKALQVEVPEGEFYGLDLKYLFKEETGADVEEVYLRYYVRFGDTWKANDNGKLPGIAGTYTSESYFGGWGGRRTTGENGWSARGFFMKSIEGNNPLSGQVPVGNYIYHVNQKYSYGDTVVWDGQRPGILERNKWYAIEQYVKINTPGKNDGVLKTWIDGIPAYEKNDIQFRGENAEHIKIDRVWMNIYHGGKAAIEQTSYAYIDNVVIAKNYIGPTVFDSNLPSAGDEPNRAPTIIDAYPVNAEVEVAFPNYESFSINVEDADGDALEILWKVNGEVVEQDVYVLDFQRTLFNREETHIEVTVSDGKGGQVSQQWFVQKENTPSVNLSVSKDTTLKGSTYTASGNHQVLTLKSDTTTMLSFDNSVLAEQGVVKAAYLVLANNAQYGDLELEIYKGRAGWTEGVHQTSGATRDYMDYESGSKWNNYLGDWIDFNGTENGASPFAKVYIDDINSLHHNVIDVTTLLNEQSDEQFTEVVLKAVAGHHVIFSKENGNKSLMPTLVVMFE